MHKPLLQLSFIALMALAPTMALAQSLGLPPPSRTVYKCEEGGKVSYSSEPCLGAKKIDIQPTRGMNKMTGTERTGSDVSKEKVRESIAEAIKPVTGMTPEQFAVETRRVNLQPAEKAKCKMLDREMPLVGKDEQVAPAEKKEAFRQRQYELRKMYRDLRC